MSSASWIPGLQLYTLGDVPARDLAGTLRQVASIGYRKVELAFHYGQSAKKLRAAFDKANLICPSAHALLRPYPGLGFWDLEDLSRLADNVKTLGAGYVIVSGPWLAPGRAEPASADDWKQTADFLNDKAAMLARHGLKLAYHNHAAEFVELPGGGTGYDILVQGLDPALVDFQLDTGWVASAGRDPVALLDTLGKRVRLMHLKDVKQSSVDPHKLVPADVGTGTVDWVRLIAAIRRAQVTHLYIEQEPPFPSSPMASARVAYRFLSKAFTGT